MHLIKMIKGDITKVTEPQDRNFWPIAILIP